MKGKVKHIVGIVISALVLPVGGYGTFMFTVALALAVCIIPLVEGVKLLQRKFSK